MNYEFIEHTDELNDYERIELLNFRNKQLRFFNRTMLTVNAVLVLITLNAFSINVVAGQCFIAFGLFIAFLHLGEIMIERHKNHATFKRVSARMDASNQSA